MAVIPLDRVWITANFKETQVEHIRPGQRVTIRVDAYDGKTFNGKVESIAAATGRAIQPAAAGQLHRQLRQGRAAHSYPHQSSMPARTRSICCGQACPLMPTVHTVADVSQRAARSRSIPGSSPSRSCSPPSWRCWTRPW